MDDLDQEVAEVKLVERLQDLGLNKYEAKTLVVLTRLGTGTAKEIAAIDDVPRTRVYDAIETLHDLGLVDIQHATPKKFTVISRDSVVRKLDNRRENTITEVSELLDQMGEMDTQREELGVWTVTGKEAIADRIFEFTNEATERLVYMTVDELLTDEHLTHLQAAADRGVNVYLAGISNEVQDRIQQEVPAAETFETLWEWSETSAGSLLVVDEEAALVSVRLDGDESGTVEETAIWGSGNRNSLVVVLRAIFTWRLENSDEVGPAGG